MRLSLYRKTKLARNGFSLIELVVVVFIMAVLSTALVSYNHTSRQHVAFVVEKAKIVEQILRAKSLSLSAQKNPSGSRTCGYGWNVDYQNQEYSLFRYESSDCTDIDPYYVSNNRGTSRILETASLDQNLLVLEPRVFGLLDVLFVPPEPHVVLRTGSDPANSATTTGVGFLSLKTREGQLQALITVTGTGLVNF